MSLVRGGLAPCEPWQEAQAGAEGCASSSSARPCTDWRYCSTTPGSSLYGPMRAASAWQRPQVATWLNGCTGERVSEARSTSCEPWQLLHTATFGSPSAASFSPCLLVQ